MTGLVDASESSRLVYAGRAAGELAFDEVVSDWDLDPVSLGGRLRCCRELVLLDPLSFPLEAVSHALGNLLLAVRIPSGISMDVILQVLTTPLLRLITLHDRVIVREEGRWSKLAERFGWSTRQRIIPDGDGAASAYEALRGAWRAEAVLHVDTPYGRFACQAGDVITEQLRAFGAYHRSDLAALLSLTRPGDHVVDVGARIGAFTVPLADRVRAAGRVTAFEPAEASRAMLRENLDLNEVAGRVEVRGEVMDGACQLDAWWWDSEQPTVDVLRVDAQESELAVLQGAARLLRTHAPAIMIRIAHDRLGAVDPAPGRLADLLREAGYRLFHNTEHRHRTDDRLRLDPVVDLGRHDRSFNLFAIHEDSPRLPGPSVTKP